MEKISILLLLAAFLLTSCSTSSSSLEPFTDEVYSIEPVATSTPTITPTITPIPSFTPLPTRPPPTLDPTFVITDTRYDELGLVVRECNIPQANFMKAFVQETCLGSPLMFEDESGTIWGTREETDNLQLIVAGDIYETRSDHNSQIVSSRKFSLIKNGDEFHSISGTISVPSPHQSLSYIDGKVVWELFIEEWITIIVDREDVRDLYDIERAYKPYSINGKLIFLASKYGKYIVIYDGKYIGIEYDDLQITYCCGGSSVDRLPGRYQFWATRGDEYYTVSIMDDEYYDILVKDNLDNQE